MSIETTRTMVRSQSSSSGLAGTSVPLGRVYAASKGDWGRSNQVEDKGGAAPRPMLARTKKQHQNSTQKHTQNTKTKRKQNGKKNTQTNKIYQHKAQIIIATITTTILITGSQTTEAKQNREMAHIITQ